VAALGIAELLAKGPKSGDELARATATHPRSLLRFLRVLASLGILTQAEDGRFTATPLATRVPALVPDPDRIPALPGGLRHERAAWEHLHYSLESGESAFRHARGMGSWDYHSQHLALGEVLHATMSRGPQRSPLRSSRRTTSLALAASWTWVEGGELCSPRFSGPIQASSGSSSISR